MLVVTNYLEIQANRKLPAVMRVGGMLMCVDISPCFPCFQAVRQEEEIFCFIYSVLALIVFGLHLTPSVQLLSKVNNTEIFICLLQGEIS